MNKIKHDVTPEEENLKETANRSTREADLTTNQLVQQDKERKKSLVSNFGRIIDNLNPFSSVKASSNEEIQTAEKEDEKDTYTMKESNLAQIRQAHSENQLVDNQCTSAKQFMKNVMY